MLGFVMTTKLIGWKPLESELTDLARRAQPCVYSVQSDSPYAWRIERGFHGYDSLGRFYDQPAQPYFLPAFWTIEGTIAAEVHAGVILGKMTGRQVMSKAAQNLRDMAQMLVPVDTGALRASITVNRVL